VLSGFLITGILMQARKNSAALGHSHVVRQFYIRRFLRIFPLYYFVVAAAFILTVTPVHDEFW
jgi:peptidoglycan/LPS O-acetylase OafA/YrhL